MHLFSSLGFSFRAVVCNAFSNVFDVACPPACYNVARLFVIIIYEPQFVLDSLKLFRIQHAASAALAAALDQVNLRGLMCIPTAGADASTTAASFRRMVALQQDLNARGHRLDTLSMGMSGDLELAVREGSTMVRVGTDLFGPRPPRT